MIYAGTGHRPESLVLGGDEAYGDALRTSLTAFATRVVSEVQPTGIISGMALGWDQALAKAAIDLEIPLTAAIPFPDQHKWWPPEAQERYCWALAHAHKIHTVRNTYSRDAYQKRNVWMVENCNHLLALFNGVSRGGTYNCIKYADRVKRPISNLWDRWVEFR